MATSRPLTDRAFASFSELAAETVAFLRDEGFEYATPVQAAVLPLFCGNKDVVVDACTGSGKTLAFLLPILEKLRNCGKKFAKHDVAFIVISPTRELATQTFRVTKHLFTTLLGLTVMRLVGGCDVGTDLVKIEETGGNVILATPGRLNDIMKKNTPLNFASLEVLVLDEADRLLDLGFETELLQIVHSLPKQRRTGLFSATQTEACEMLVKAGLRNPLRINVTTTMTDTAERVSDFSQKTPQSLSISAIVLPLDQKWNQFVQLLLDHPHDKIIVYGLTCACVDYWFYVLRKMDALKDYKIRAVHGRMPQSGREKAIQAFTSNIAGVLLATDLAARGLDIPEVQRVVQLDAPQDPNAFVHRVGRTARMGRRGKATIYLAPNEESYIKFLQLRKVPIKRKEGGREGEDQMSWLRRLSETEREAMLKGITAFTSYVRAYSNHHCPYIFHLKELDLGKLAYTFGLLYLPGMKEIKVKNAVDFVSSTVHPQSIPFVDKAREAERQQKLAQMPRSAQVKIEERKGSKKRGQKRMAIVQESVKKLKKCRNPDRRDLEELQEDYKLYKLEKKAKKREGKASPDPKPLPPDVTPGPTTGEKRPSSCLPSAAPRQRSSKKQCSRDEGPRNKHGRDALRASLRKKLDALQQNRQVGGHCKY